VEEVGAGEHPIQPLVGGSRSPPLHERPRILVKGCDMDVQVEPAGAHELKASAERGVHAPRFDPRDERLGYARATCQRPLGQVGSTPSLMHELSGIHGSDDTHYACK
jgi:hypothetical protein